MVDCRKYEPFVALPPVDARITAAGTHHASTREAEHLPEFRNLRLVGNDIQNIVLVRVAMTSTAALSNHDAVGIRYLRLKGRSPQLATDERTAPQRRKSYDHLKDRKRRKERDKPDAPLAKRFLHAARTQQSERERDGRQECPKQTSRETPIRGSAQQNTTASDSCSILPCLTLYQIRGRCAALLGISRGKSAVPVDQWYEKWYTILIN